MAQIGASFWTRANALLRKSLTFQKRNIRQNVRLISVPILLCLLLLLIQILVNDELDKPENRCGCACVDTNGDGTCEKVCGLKYSTLTQATTCPNPHPPEWTPLLQVPNPVSRAVVDSIVPYQDLPRESCKRTGSCPVTMLFTGNNHSFGEAVARNMFSSPFSLTSPDILDTLASSVLGTHSMPEKTNFLEPAFYSGLPIYNVQSKCPENPVVTVPINISSMEIQQEMRCVQSLHLWRNTSSEINNELYKGYRYGNDERKINELLSAYDFSNSNMNIYNVSIWYNSTFKNNTGQNPMGLVRVPRSINLVSNAYLQFLLGGGSKILLEFVKEMPKPETSLRLDFSSLIGALFYTWVILQLFPVVLTSLVYEKEQKLRIMMKMHGLGDGPYWLISYIYFLTVSLIYMLCFVVFGSLIGLKFFTLNDYSIQFVFYFIYSNLQVSTAFLASTMFSNVKTAAVIGYIIVFGTGLLGVSLFQFFLNTQAFPRVWITVIQLYPGFSLYRGLYEFGNFSFLGGYMGTKGMRWRDLNNKENGMKEVLIIMTVEWFVVLVLAYFLDQAVASSGSVNHPLVFFQRMIKKLSSSMIHGSQRQDNEGVPQMDKPDVAQEMEKVNRLLLESDTSHSIICKDLRKVYPGRDGNPEKLAVRGMSLALPRGECFGLLGPNGAGKTSFISIMIGLTKSTSGMALVQGLDINTKMDEIYTSMGVCPQHDLLWETLTGTEHLLFYGRLKNLKGSVLTEAVEESLKGVNLFHGGVADKVAGQYSGGMKRRLSVAISLIGDPKVVYMDEPSTGLDPASRNSLWNVVKRAKRDRAIILTTHSMEEAEVLCDRLGVFVAGSLQCIGNAKQLKARYGGSYVFTMTTSSNHEQEVESLVRSLSANANKIYHLSGTQKFELPKHEVNIADVFEAVEHAKSKFTVFAWGLADTTLEDVFIKVALGAQTTNVLT